MFLLILFSQIAFAQPPQCSPWPPDGNIYVIGSKKAPTPCYSIMDANGDAISPEVMSMNAKGTALLLDQSKLDDAKLRAAATRAAELKQAGEKKALADNIDGASIDDLRKLLKIMLSEQAGK